MKIGYHGGKCCGVKTIFNMGYNPSEMLPALAETTSKVSVYGVHNKDAMGHNVSSTDSPFFGETAKETYRERLIRYIDFLRVNRPSGLIEIQLMEYPNGPSHCYPSQGAWYPVLKELGFKMVARFKNSNSSNFVTTWLLVLFNGQNDVLITSENKETLNSPDPEFDEYDDYEEDDTEEGICPCGDPSCTIGI